jgi:hypothetical protein
MRISIETDHEGHDTTRGVAILSTPKRVRVSLQWNALQISPPWMWWPSYLKSTTSGVVVKEDAMNRSCVGFLS